ncbi:MAG: DUF4156 domain-containing protein [Halofilum sp. (in: g-proteobacteria)]|nr:DUF4156 domain-containing protein [Halofilum sp. (in: g-proteobacteria)]
MKASNRNVILAVAMTAVLGGCSFVTVDPGAEDVLVLAAERTKDCERLGQTRVSVATKIGFIKRGKPAISDNLETLARNSAAEMGGDTITAETEVSDGKQTFGIFDCVK